MPYALSGRRVLILSSEAWGTVHVSKHHYAVELARRGNEVYFLGPPRSGGAAWSSERHAQIDNLTIVSYRPWFPLALRFHARPLFDLLMRAQVAILRRRLPPLHVVWSFDRHLYRNLRDFGATRVLYHPVDQVDSRHAIDAARDSHLVLSVADEILRRFTDQPQPRLLIGHGLAAPFVELAQQDHPAREAGRAPRFGYVGNLFIPSLDRARLREIILASPGVEFHFWGAARPGHANIGGDGAPASLAFVRWLEERDNVRLHGPVTTERLAAAMQGLDGFLVCYDATLDPNGGSNTHKLLEYLSTGRAVVSSRITAYEAHRDLVVMSQRRDNADFPQLFADALARLDELNAAPLRRRRIELALRSSYAMKLDEIERALP